MTKHLLLRKLGDGEERMLQVVSAEDAFALLACLPRCIGLSEGEIDRCETAGGVPFATDFRRLLRIAGGSFEWLFPNGLKSPNQVATLRADAAELSMNTDWHLGPSDIVIEFHDQGYGMVFLRSSGNESQVYRYLEGSNSPIDTGLSLGLYLAMVLEQRLSSNA